MRTVDHHMDVTLSSNGSLSHFPQNTLTTFTNVLPLPLYPRSGSSKLYIRAKRLLLSKRLTIAPKRLPPASQVGHILIHELEVQAINSQRHPTLCQFNLIKALRDNSHKGSNYLLFDFEHTPWLALRASPVTHLSIRLCNLLSQPLPLSEGPATLLQVEIATMNEEREFTVTCLSHSPFEAQLYPGNSPTSFRAKMPQEMTLDGWEVALAGISLPRGNLTTRRVTITVSLVDADVEETVSLNLDHFQHVEKRQLSHIIKHLHYRFEKLKRGVKTFLFEDERGRWYLQNDMDHPMVIKTNSLFNAIFDAPVERTWRLEPGERKFIQPAGVTAHPDRARYPSVALLYCSIVEPNAVSSQMVPLMHIIPMHKLMASKDREVLYEPQHLMFYPVKNQSFSDIELSLHTATGELYPLSYKRPVSYRPRNPNLMSDQEERGVFNAGGTVVTLLFRPRNK